MGSGCTGQGHPFRCHFYHVCATTHTPYAPNALSLRDDGSTGPDLLPARILKRCAEQQAKPLQFLLQRMLQTKSWPESWREHWVVPIYKKKAVFVASNYRCIHLTAQLSKVAERLLLPLVEPHISRTVAFGPNQFAHTKCRGARDALAYLTMSWLLALNRRKKVAVYCSDVSGVRQSSSWAFTGETPMPRSTPHDGRADGILAAATHCTCGG